MGGWKPEDEYLDLSRSDSSRYVRASVRLGWSKGQQLWDSMFNNSLKWARIWTNNWVHWRRNWTPDQRPPWYTPSGYRQVLDPKHIVPWPDSEFMADKRNSIVYVSPSGSTYYDHFYGCKVYVMADRNVVCWTPLGILPIKRIPQKEQNYEMAIFASKPPRSGTMVRQKIKQAFRIHKGNTHGRVRGWGWDGVAPMGLYKNGVRVGNCYVGEFTSGVSVTVTTDFLVDDILEIRMPANPQGRNVAISIVGEYLP